MCERVLAVVFVVCVTRGGATFTLNKSARGQVRYIYCGVYSVLYMCIYAARG